MGLEGWKEDRGREGAGLSQDTSVLVKAGARESCTDRNNEPKMAASQSSRKRNGRVSAHCLHSSLVDCCERMPDPSGGQGGRLDSNKPGWAEVDSRVELWVSEGLQFVRAGFEGCMGKCGTKSHWVLNCWLISSCFHSSLPLSIWLGGRIRTGLPKEGMCSRACLFAHVCKGRILQRMLVYNMTLWSGEYIL